MAVILDTSVHSVSEMKNLSFARKITADRIRSIVGDIPFGLWAFQENGGAGVNVNNEQGDAAADMTLNNAGMWTGAGWYTPHPGFGSAGMRGFGLQNDGGASGYMGTVPDSPNININGETQLTLICILNLNDGGEFGQGHFMNKSQGGNGFMFYHQPPAGTRGLVAGAVGNPGLQYYFTNTNPRFQYGFWNVFMAVFDRAEAAGSRIKIYINGIQQPTTVGVEFSDATLLDAGNVLSVMDVVASNRASNGEGGLFAVIPGAAMSAADAASLVELRGLFQPTVANQPTIPSGPGMFGPPDYQFDGAANPHLASYQLQLLKTSQGTIMLWFAPDNLTTYCNLFSLTIDGVAHWNQDEIFVDLNGTAGGDPILMGNRVGGVVGFVFTMASNLISPGGSNFIAITSDGSTLRGYLNGEEQALTFSAGANTGQWLDEVVGANVLSLGCMRRNTLQNQFLGRTPKLVILDEPLSGLEIAQIAQRNALGWRRSYGI